MFLHLYGHHELAVFSLRHELMPKDDWAKATAKDRGRQALRDGSALLTKKQVKGKGRKRRTKKTGAWSPNTVLWFGKHKDTAIKDVPLQYLNWLAKSEHNNWRFVDLATYLRQYLRKVK